MRIMSLETELTQTPSTSQVELRNDGDVIDDNVHQKVLTFRFKFLDEVVAQITHFAKIHQYDTTDNYREAWTEWCDENDDMIHAEKQRLKNLGYTGCVLDKMYKAGRYYFRNKELSHVAVQPVRRKYISTSKTLLDAMDVHIQNEIGEEDYSPAQGFDEFCEAHKEILREEIKNLMKSENKLNADELSNKIKKTYKNRYFIISRNRQKKQNKQRAQNKD